MAPDKERKPTRREFEVDYYTKELGRPLQRKLLQRRLNDITDSNITAASHGDDPKMEVETQPPREDRAG